MSYSTSTGGMVVKTSSARAVLISLIISGFTEACRKGGCFSIQFLKVTSFNLGVTAQRLIFTIIQHVKLVKLPLKESGGCINTTQASKIKKSMNRGSILRCLSLGNAVKYPIRIRTFSSVSPANKLDP